MEIGAGADKEQNDHEEGLELEDAEHGGRIWSVIEGSEH